MLERINWVDLVNIDDREPVGTTPTRQILVYAGGSKWKVLTWNLEHQKWFDEDGTENRAKIWRWTYLN